ncbi:unnamed protein product [Meganyctiphanes norvegica]|uniref:Fibrinogen C-terminal domain-containing protein n=1 Tax=Meganyctiphanes norvegica TaxID=48144 RepID=A0AAV2R701_MEGNR
MKLTYFILGLLALVISDASGHQAEDGSSPRNCQNIRENGFVEVGHYVVYNTVNNTNEATMIYCGEKDGMQLVDKEDGTAGRSGARNCKELQDQGMNQDGPNIIYPYPDHPETPLLVLCDQTTQGGGWTVILRRDDSYDDLTDFARTFEEYAAGFGYINYDFYIGNDVIHALTNPSQNELWVTIEDLLGETGYAHYQYFHVNAREGYAREGYYGNNLPPYMMDCGLYEGTIGDGLEYQNGMGFSTLDQDNDVHDDINCAKTDGGGGWWYRACYNGLLTGPYGTDYFRWFTEDSYYILSKAQMMVRPSSTCT